MTAFPPPFTDKANAYLAKADERLAATAPLDVVRRIERLVDDHDRWRRICLNLNPAESSLTDRARRLLSSEMASRLSEGVPGDKVYPHGRQNQHIDEIEATIIALARRQFGARYVEWRPVSTSMANAAVFFALLGPGDAILVQAEDGGGNFSYHAGGPAGLACQRILDAPWRGDTFELDLDALADMAKRERPRMIVVGGSNVLFPYPVSALRRIADEIDALLVYDAAHLGLLIAKGDFQRPLEEGAHIVTLSTHKVMGGPVGGLILTNDADIAAKLFKVTFPGFLQTRDQNKYAALAVSLAEAEAFGEGLAKAMVSNAKALARGLEAEAVPVLARERGYTRTHQIFLSLGQNAQCFEARCQQANILVSDCALAGEISQRRRTGSRLSTHELSRLGLQAPHMSEVASLIGRAYRGEPSDAVARDVARLLAPFTHVRFSFDDAARG